jgi:hypothetical protein
LKRWSTMKLNLPVAVAGALGILGFIFVFHFIKPREYFGWETAPIVEELYYPSILLLAGYVFMLLYILLQDVTVGGAVKMLRSIRLKHIIAAVVMFVAAKGLLGLITGPSEEKYTPLLVAKGTILIAITRPLLFIVPHIIYFGPIILLAVLLWKPMSRLMRQHGFGLILFVLLNLPMALNPESRRSVLFVPLVAIFAVLATEELNWKRWHYWALGGIALLLSKIWYPINQGSLEGAKLEFPAQHYFMNFGPWVADGPFLVMAVTALLAGGFVYWLIRKGRVAEAAERNRITPTLVPEGKVHA